ncbi:MAG: hydrogenase maturation protease [Proteobacteria bacterium]|nr:hydrogenase maturation protease [Pseudomonadota bacterium]
MIELIHTCHTLILGCGNPLFGDDGFGPAVIQYMETRYEPADGCGFIDVGTSVRDLLFDIILSDQRPKKIIILDAVDMPGRMPGELFDIDVDQISPEKTSDFSLHQFPTTNMLKELKDHTAIDITVMVVQLESLPDTVAPGLSEPVRKAVALIAEKLIRDVGGKRLNENVKAQEGGLAEAFVF